MNVSSKIWGRSLEVATSPFFEFHHILVKPSSYCSIHTHEYKYNLFYCLKGVIKVKVWKNGDNGLIDETLLFPGQSTTVAPNERHQFETLKVDEIRSYFPEWKDGEMVEVIELYFPEPINKLDIKRFSEGGSMYTKDFTSKP